MLKNKKILITGGTGTLGYRIVEKLLTENVAEIRVFSRDENKQCKMKEKYPNVVYYLGAVEDIVSLEKAVKDIDIIFHLAAMKHVEYGETNPYQTVLTNVVGSINVIRLAEKHNVLKVIGISTDKAVDPKNIYGMTKRIMEYLFLWANSNSGYPRYYIVRYGNVFGSSGSVVYKWKKAVLAREKLKVTNPEMERFYFSIEDAIDLIWVALLDDNPGSIYTLKMKSLKLGELARIIQKHGIEITGNRGNEKKGECLLSEAEIKKTIFLPHYTKSNLQVCRIGKEDVGPNYVFTMPYTTNVAEPLEEEIIMKYLSELTRNGET